MGWLKRSVAWGYPWERLKPAVQFRHLVRSQRPRRPGNGWIVDDPPGMQHILETAQGSRIGGSALCDLRQVVIACRQGLRCAGACPVASMCCIPGGSTTIQ